MININNIDVSKWFKFPELLITIGVILLIISIILILIAYLTAGKEKADVNEEIEKTDVSDKSTKILKTTMLETVQDNNKQETVSETEVNELDKSKETLNETEDDEEEIELL